MTDEPPEREQMPRNYFEMMGGRPRCGWQYGDGKRTIASENTICGVCMAEWETNDVPPVAPCIVDSHNKRENRRRHRLESSYNPFRVPALMYECKDCKGVEMHLNHMTVEMHPCWPRILRWAIPLAAIGWVIILALWDLFT